MIVLQGGKNENNEMPEEEKNEKIDRHFEKFPTCVCCKNALYREGEKQEFFVCPNCGRPIKSKKDLIYYNANFCGYCGFKIYSALEETKKALKRKWLETGKF